MTGAAVARFAPAPGVRYLPIIDWPGSTLALGSHLREPSEVVARFIDVACAVRDRERVLIDVIQDCSALTGSQRTGPAQAGDADQALPPGGQTGPRRLTPAHRQLR